jgi:hypothetical protein
MRLSMDKDEETKYDHFVRVSMDKIEETKYDHFMEFLWTNMKKMKEVC